jgi:cell division protein ZapA
MSAKPKSIDVSILGRMYKVACTDEEKAAVMAAGEYLDGKMSEIKAAGRVTSIERMAVMAALNIAHELLAERSGLTTQNGFDMESAKRRMVSMQAMLDDVLLPQERLI